MSLPSLTSGYDPRRDRNGAVSYKSKRDQDLLSSQSTSEIRDKRRQETRVPEDRTLVYYLVRGKGKRHPTFSSTVVSQDFWGCLVTGSVTSRRVTEVRGARDTGGPFRKIP